MSMENVIDVEEFTVFSKVRAGLKREFAFALKSQNEIVSSLGRFRVRTPVIGVNEVEQASNSKRYKKSDQPSATNAEDVGIEKITGDSEGGLTGGIVDVVSDDDDQSHLVETLRAEKNTELTVYVSDDERKFDLDHSKDNADGKTVPRVLKDLMSTGLLEGLSVRYIRGYKSKLQTETGLRGVVKGSGILCLCDECKGEHVVTPSVFELHAGSSNKRPTDYIYLENGHSFRDVLNACKECKLDKLEATIESVIGHVSDMETPKHITKADRSQEKSILKSSDNTKTSVSSAHKRDGKLTRKDSQLHKLIFAGDDDLPDGTEVGYFTGGEKKLSGHKQGDGIYCHCCNKVVSPSQFEAHAGYASHRKPYLNIYTSNGVSLHELSLSISKTRRLSSKDSDDLCSICCQRGDLLCCDGCPRVFHKECIPLPEIPDGDWYCRYCQDKFQMEKYAKRNANAKAAGRVDGVDSIEEIRRRCIRIMKPQESESGGCALCRGHDFAKGEFSRRTVILCDQCEKEFHVGCLQDHGIQDLKELPEGKWFCCFECDRIYSVLQQMIEDGVQQVPDCLLNLTKQKNEASGSDDIKLDIKWQLLSGKMSCKADTRALLGETVSVFHEQFDPIILPDSNQDIIPHMVYGRNLKDTELGGMYCAVLTVDSRIVSAGVFRILGKEIAELPLVATSSGWEKLGYFHVLYSCIEKLLGELDVNYLWLPAASEAKPFWTNKFGFSGFPKQEFEEFKKRYSLMLFDGTCALRKSIPKKAEPVQDFQMLTYEYDAMNLSSQSHDLQMLTYDAMNTSSQAQDLQMLTSDAMNLSCQSHDLQMLTYDAMNTSNQAQDLQMLTYDAMNNTSNQAQDPQMLTYDAMNTISQAQDLQMLTYDAMNTSSQAQDLQMATYDAMNTSSQAQNLQMLTYDAMNTSSQAQDFQMPTYDAMNTSNQAQNLQMLTYDAMNTSSQAQDLQMLTYDAMNTSSQAQDLQMPTYDAMNTSNQAQNLQMLTYDAMNTSSQAQDLQTLTSGMLQSCQIQSASYSNFAGLTKGGL